MNYHHRRLVVDATLIGAVVVTAVSGAVFESHGTLFGQQWNEFTHQFAEHISHWLVDVSGAEICATVVYRILAIAE